MNHILTKKIAKTALSGKNYWKLLLCYFLVITLPTIILNKFTLTSSILVFLGTFIILTYTKTLFEKKKFSDAKITTNSIFTFTLLSGLHALIIGIPLIIACVPIVIIVMSLIIASNDILILIPIFLIFLPIFLVIYELLMTPMNNIAVKLMHEPNAKFGECFKYGWKGTFSNFTYYFKLTFSLIGYFLLSLVTLGVALIFIQPSIVAIRYQAALEIYNRTNSNSPTNINDTLNLDKIDVY